jgi:hypothetical protein
MPVEAKMKGKVKIELGDGAMLDKKSVFDLGVVEIQSVKMGEFSSESEKTDLEIRVGCDPSIAVTLIEMMRQEGKEG